ncbi:Phosphoribosylaminoimidazole-succinocarboxamide synthase chloroplastic [Zea mays]|uniref:phosphoribosylaminoimidazolesuccinocarboxamide synthase n=1 Tax=Zea mays TaxID=4577 RepID=A0A1D6I659_MAIZE|nr:Phosphoribosylaminoimidazole-succinocarboxamide synthase chloroplastic [Zea mays]
MKHVHTSNSSRYWIANSYEDRFISGLEPENVDKEFLRLWFKNNCNPYEDTVYFLHTVVRITCEFCSIMIQLIFFLNQFMKGYQGMSLKAYGTYDC